MSLAKAPLDAVSFFEPGTPAKGKFGYCALAASLGYKAPGDALTGQIVEGKVNLNYNAEAARVWGEAISANIRKGQENWPRLNPL